MRDPTVLKTLDRALYILTLFDGNKPSWGVTELARHLDLPKSVVQKTLATFARRGFMYQEDVSRRYRLGPRLLTLARVAEPELARMADPHMKRLAEATMETVKLTVVDGTETVIVAAVESPQSLRMTGRVGERNPLHRGATNKILAAHMPRSEVVDAVRSYYRRQSPGAYGGQSLDPLDEVLADLDPTLDAIRARGWASSVGELEDGVKAVAVPVIGYGGKTVACLSVVGPSSRMKESQNGRLLTLLREAGAAISEALGHGAATEASVPDAIMEASVPDAIMEASVPDAIMEASDPDAIMEASEHDAIMEASEHDSTMGAPEPDTAADAPGRGVAAEAPASPGERGDATA